MSRQVARHRAAVSVVGCLVPVRYASSQGRGCRRGNRHPPSVRPYRQGCQGVSGHTSRRSCALTIVALAWPCFFL